jgi:DNA polymerase V
VIPLRFADVNDNVVNHPASTYVMRCMSGVMTGAGIYMGDLLVIDRALSAWSGCVVVACINGEYYVRRYIVADDHTVALCAMPVNKAPPLVLEDADDFEIWGVVTHALGYSHSVPSAS